MTPARISVCMIAQDEERRIGASLESAQWADEIVVIDGGSRDDTVAIARSLGARVESRPWPGDFATQYRRSLEEATGEWVFKLDADEVVTPELAEQLRAAADDPGEYVGFRVRRRNYFCGRWVRHCGWWPDPQLRLVRREGATIEGAPGHETTHVRGPIGDLTGALEHDTHPTVKAALARVERYSDLLAPERARRKRIRGRDVLGHTLAAFFRKYVVQQGFRDGTDGYLISAIHAMVKFSVYAKAWELQRRS